MSQSLEETQVNIIAQGTRLKGQITFEKISRVHGELLGEVYAKPGSTLILGETAVIEGNIDADTLIIDGYVKGDVSAKTKVVLSRTSRVIGSIKTPSLIVEFGAYFEGNSKMLE
jgi:cytoskeletal protein CcmA (bactofilin family)